MSTDSLQYFDRARPAPDPAVGRANSSAAPERTRGNILEHRAMYVPVTEWSALDSEERAFVDTLLAYLFKGKGALVRAFDTARARSELDDSADLGPLFERIVRHQVTHVRAIGTLRRRIHDQNRDEDIGEPDLEPLAEFMGTISQPLGRSEDHDLPEAQELSAIAIAISQIVFGVATQTGYRTLNVFLQRNGVLDECADLFDALCRSDEELADSVAESRHRLRQTMPVLESRVASQVEGCVVACTNLVRDVQDRFDFLSLGLVPDEFVAFALNRCFELGESPDEIE